MPNKERGEFTMEDAFAIQKQHLNFYETTLKPEFYAKVKAKVEAVNKKGYNSPFQVCRGTDIDNIFANIFRG